MKLSLFSFAIGVCVVAVASVSLEDLVVRRETGGRVVYIEAAALASEV